MTGASYTKLPDMPHIIILFGHANFFHLHRVPGPLSFPVVHLSSAFPGCLTTVVDLVVGNTVMACLLNFQ